MESRCWQDYDRLLAPAHLFPRAQVAVINKVGTLAILTKLQITFRTASRQPGSNGQPAFIIKL